MQKQTGAVSTRSGKKISVLHRSGMVVRTPSSTIALDPRRPLKCDYAFISHAHIDHVHTPSGNSSIIASKETAVLAKIRGYNLANVMEAAPGIDLIDAGHILGSRAVLIEDSIFYTGDFSRRDRGFLKGSMGVRCDTLIMETTYGDPKYVFRDSNTIVSEASKVIAESFDKCRPVVLSGYPLGKAQLITYLFRNWEPVYVHESVFELNQAHIELGVDLPTLEPYQSALKSSKLDRRPWIMIAPSMSGRSHFIRLMRENYDAVVIAFTGWAVDPGYRFRTGVDYAFDLSDHCDFRELVELAKYCNPSKIYTVHGFAREFAEHLNFLGFDAQPLESSEQSTLSSYY